MSTGFTKLFSSITQSTVWQEPDHVRIVWITMLALADRNGEVQASVPGLAHSARVSLENTLNALQVLTNPDPYSRTKDNDGRRIEEVDGGWALLNHAKYRAKLSEEDRRAYKADKQRKYRERDKAAEAAADDSTGVHGGQSGTNVTQAEAEADSEAPKASAPAEQKPSRAKAGARKGAKLTFDQWVEEVKAAGEQAIPADHEAFQIALNAGMPKQYIRIAWHVFRASHTGRPDKKQVDWRKAFANYVRHNYFKLWRSSPDGFELTSVGVQSQREMEGEANGS